MHLVHQDRCDRAGLLAPYVPSLVYENVANIPRLITQTKYVYDLFAGLALCIVDAECTEDLEDTSANCTKDLEDTSAKCTKDLEDTSAKCTKDLEDTSANCTKDLEDTSANCTKDLEDTSAKCTKDLEDTSANCTKDLEDTSAKCTEDLEDTSAKFPDLEYPEVSVNHSAETEIVDLANQTRDWSDPHAPATRRSKWWGMECLIA